MTNPMRWLALLLCSLPVAAQEPVMVDFEAGFDPARVETRSVDISVVEHNGGHGLRLDARPEESWPGITLKPADGVWDLDAYQWVSLDVQNVGDNAVEVCVRVDNAGADGIRNCVNGRLAVAPGAKGTVRVPLTRRTNAPGIHLFGMRGYPEGLGDQDTPSAIDPAQVNQVLVFLNRPSAAHAFVIDNFRPGGRYAPPPTALTPEAFFPYIDTFGQYKHRDWPGKVHSLDELRGRIAEEDNDLAAHPGPDTWNAWGGWANGPQLEATGFFRTAKHEGKWWLVDPDGRLFFSHGIDCVRSDQFTPVDDREHWFEDFPGNRPEYKDLWGKQNHVVVGYYKGKQPRTFNITAANLHRKYGDDYEEAFADRAHTRLRSWGLNTIGNWSSGRVMNGRRTPYVTSLWYSAEPLRGSSGYWRQFPDPFHESFAASLERNAANEAQRTANDPWCIGFFVDNELSWGDDVDLALATLASPADQPAKQAMLSDLRAEYDTIAALNAAWGTAHASWDALAAATQPPDRKVAREDLLAFNRRIAAQYFTVIRDALKRHLPNHLYLGCRYAWVNPLVANVAAEYCDVVSFNIYRRGIDGWEFPGGPDADVPIIIGEFHFGALDRGALHTGLVRVESQDERADTYRSYVTGVLQHPQFVGCHWFQYMDEPATGRALDGENYQIGFVDMVDTPYPETLAASREIGERMYQIRSEGK